MKNLHLEKVAAVIVMKYFLSHAVVCLFVLFTVNAHAQQFERQETSLVGMQRVSGHLFERRQVSIAGRVFSKALDTDNIGRNSFKQVVFECKGYDAFEAYVGVEDDDNERPEVVFTVLGDGQLLFKSPPMKIGSRPVRVSVPLKGVSGVTLRIDDVSRLKLLDSARKH